MDDLVTVSWFQQDQAARLLGNNPQDDLPAPAL
jgi:hypothetical protein